MQVKTKRVNKTKEQLTAQIEHKSKVEREKTLVKLIFPALATQKTVYDGQTVLGALSGFIKVEIDKKSASLLVKDLPIDLSKEEDSEIKSAISTLIGMLALENAKDMSVLLERFGNILAQYSANEYMKQPINTIKIENIVA